MVFFVCSCPQCFQLFSQFGIALLRRYGLCYHNVVNIAEAICLLAEGFSNLPLDAVSVYGFFADPSRNSQPQSCMGQIVRGDVQGKIFSVSSLSAIKDSAEFATCM